jgi:hypothetical protein
MGAAGDGTRQNHFSRRSHRITDPSRRIDSPTLPDRRADHIDREKADARTSTHVEVAQIQARTGGQLGAGPVVFRIARRFRIVEPFHPISQEILPG